jgi:perosamine synthetase
MNRLRCYPPAETKIPISAFLRALLPHSLKFEDTLSSYLGVKQCMLANSGRALLYKLLSAVKANHPGRNEVMIPGYTCYSVAASVARAGLSIRPYDLDPKSLSPDMDSMRQHATERTLAIVVQHLFGMPTALVEIRHIAKEVGAILIEDAAQALGGSLNGTLLGTECDFGLFSFGRGKPLPLGSGGALVGADETIFQSMQFGGRSTGILRFVLSAAAQLASKPYIYGIAEMLPIGLGETVFEPNFGVTPMEPMTAKLGNNGIRFLPELNAHRNRIADVYRKVFGEDTTIPLIAQAKPVYTRFPLLVETGPISGGLRNLGVRRMYPKAIADEDSIFTFLSADRAATPGATRIAQRLVTLPTHKNITEELAGRIADAVIRSYS